MLLKRYIKENSYRNIGFNMNGKQIAYGSMVNWLNNMFHGLIFYINGKRDEYRFKHHRYGIRYPDKYYINPFTSIKI